MSYNGTVTCSYCYNSGHNLRGCTKLKTDAAADIANGYSDSYSVTKYKNSKVRRCSFCDEDGHTRRTCKIFKEKKILLTNFNIDLRKAMMVDMLKQGIGVGALMTATRSRWCDEKETYFATNSLYLVKSIRWEGLTWSNFRSQSLDCLLLESVGTKKERYGNRYNKDTFLAYYPKVEDLTPDVSKRYHAEVVSPVNTKCIMAQLPDGWPQSPVGKYGKDSSNWNWIFENMEEKMKRVREDFPKLNGA